MGKRLIVQARGKGSHTYRVKKKAFRYKIQFPQKCSGEGEVLKLIASAAHSAPLAKIKYDKGIFYIPSHKNMFEGQKIKLDTEEIKEGNVVRLKNVPMKARFYNIESKPHDGGKFMKSAGNSAMVNRVIGDKISIIFPSKKEKKLNPECRVVIGTVAGSGRLDKPVVKAGKKFHIKKAKSKLWPRTSAVKMNAIDHPFGSGRAKNPKSKIAKRNAPPGRRVGLIRPRRTGKRK